MLKNECFSLWNKSEFVGNVIYSYNEWLFSTYVQKYTLIIRLLIKLIMPQYDQTEKQQ